MTDSAAGPRPRPRPRPTDRPLGGEPGSAEPAPAGAGTEVGTAGQASADSSEPPPTPGGGRRRVVLAGRVLAVICVAAGVAVFVTARAASSSQAVPRASTSASAAQVDDRALLTDPDLAQSYVAAALSEIVIVSESDYRTLDDALAAGLSVTTGAYEARYRAALTGASAQQRIANHTITSIDVLQAGIGQITDGGNQAKVLVFGRLHQTGDDVASGAEDTPVTLCLTLVRRGQQTLISDLSQGANAGLPPGTQGVQAAAEAARAEVVNTLSYSRADFAADLARAQAGATGALKTQLSDAAAALQASLTKGNYDLAGTVTSVAMQQVAGDTAAVLVSAEAERVSGGGQPQSSAVERYVVNVERASGAWLVSSIDPVGAD